MKVNLKNKTSQYQILTLFSRPGDSVSNLIRREYFEFELFVSKQFKNHTTSMHLAQFLTHQVLNRKINFCYLIWIEFLINLQINRNLNNHNFKYLSGFVLKDSSGKKIDLPTGGEDYLGKDI